MKFVQSGSLRSLGRGVALTGGFFFSALALSALLGALSSPPHSLSESAGDTTARATHPASGAASDEELRTLLAHGHSHSHAAPASDEVSIPEKGRALSVAPAGAGAAAPHIEDELLLHLRGPLSRTDLERHLAPLGLSVLRHDTAVDVYVLQAAGNDRVGALLALLQNEPWVAWAEPNFVASISQCCHTPFLTEKDPVDGLNRVAFRNCGVDAARATGTGGEGVTIAVLDTGIDSRHRNLSGQVLSGIDLVNVRGAAADDSGHGTAMAGLIAARTMDGGAGIVGVAPSSKLLSVKVADHQGNASVADLATGITQAVARGARILNLSLGCRVGSRTLAAAVEYALARGALLVAAVGNDNVNTPLYPAAYPGVLAVASTSADGELGFVTNVCKRADLAAPGEKILSTIPGNLYRGVSGTSCAAAVVSGAAALLWAKNPALTAEQVAALLKYSAQPIPALAAVRHLFRFGRLDMAEAMRRNAGMFVDVAVTRARCLPRRPLLGQAATLEVEIENQGTTPVVSGGVVASLGGLGGRGAYAPASASLSAGAVSLAVGERTTVRIPWTPERAGPVVLNLRAAPATGERDLANNAAEVAVTVGGGAEHSVEVADIEVGEPAADASTLELSATIENAGNQDEANVVCRAFAGGAEFDTAAVSLVPGESRRLSFLWRVPSPAPRSAVAFAVRVEPSSFQPEKPVTAYLDTVLGTADPRQVKTQYQQSGDVDIIPDAPFRVRPNHPYLPLLVFVPDKGSGDPNTALTFDSLKIFEKDAPEATLSGNLLYADSFGPESAAAPTATTPGMTILDEDGAVQVTEYGAPDLNLFKDQPLTQRGRHNILRFPRAALGVPNAPIAPVEKYFFVQADWTYSTHALSWVATKHGTTKKMLKVRFETSDLPTLPGEAKYFDAHVHTIAEWYFSDHLEIFSPMQAYGGPIQMVKECAWAVGLTSSLDDVKDNVVTTDHNCFYGQPGDGDPNSALRRPVFGPTSVARSTTPGGTVKTEFQRMREIFGASAGEELAFSQYVTVGPAGVPIGAHMLSYRGQHFDGPWHGGSDVSAALHEGDPIYLETFLSTLATSNPAENSKAFTYAAHPFHMQGWSDLNLSKSLGIDPLYRTHDYCSPYSQNFILKGLQIFNEPEVGFLPGEAIDFNDLNPFVAPTWAGSPDWDRTLQVGLSKWHGYLATLMRYNFLDETGKVFLRKLYIAGGTDAHGDFNYSQHRLATLVEHPSTYTVTSMAFGGVRTYAFGDGKAGATAGERAMDAFADGNCVATDGPIANFDLDGDGHWNSATLKWHDAANLHENAEGRMGGDGAYDGSRTLLVRRGTPDLFFRYQYANSPDLGSAGGSVASIKIYKDQAGTPNPTVARTYAGQVVQVVKGVGSLPTTAAGSQLTKQVNLAAEGSVTKLTAYSLGAFTGGDPDVAPLGPAERRCYTNPVWAIPVDMDITVNTSGITTANPKIPAGALTVQFKFDATMMPLPYAVHVKALDAAGNSTDVSVAPASTCSPTTGWTSNLVTGVENGIYTVKNVAAIPLGAFYPTSGKHTFVVYFKDAPKDLHGNALNSVAKTFTVNAPAGGGGKKCFVGTLLAQDGPGGSDGTDADRSATSRWLLWGLVLALLVGWEVFGRRRVVARAEGRAAERGGEQKAGS
ncbi:MAG: S8 family serine peptidase [Planctomycetes bacterium]|nr:S8 family serine peptidase [Planctomycetota bacterium]